MFAKILVAVDGSRSAENVLPDAVKMAHRLGSELILAYVLPDDSGPVNGIEANTAQAVADSYLERAVRSLAEQQINARGVLLYGEPAEEIVRCVMTNDIDAIAMTTHGRGGWRRVIIGSVADQVVRTAPVPVLVRRIQEHSPERLSLQGDGVVVPLDGSELAEGVIPYALELARAMQSRITLLRAISYQELTEIDPTFQGVAYDARVASHLVDAELDKAVEYLRAVRARFADSGVDIELDARFGVPTEVILGVAAESNAGLIALSTHGRSGVRRAVLGSVATTLLQEASVPVMTLSPLAIGSEDAYPTSEMIV